MLLGITQSVVISEANSDRVSGVTIKAFPTARQLQEAEDQSLYLPSAAFSGTPGPSNEDVPCDIALAGLEEVVQRQPDGIKTQRIEETIL